MEFSRQSAQRRVIDVVSSEGPISVGRAFRIIGEETSGEADRETLYTLVNEYLRRGYESRLFRRTGDRGSYLYSMEEAWKY